MSSSLNNILSDQKRPPFQINQLPGRGFNALTFINYNYFERWIFPKNFPAQLEITDGQIPVIRSFRYNINKEADKQELTELEPAKERLDKDIMYYAKVQDMHKLFIQTMQQQGVNRCRTTLSLSPLEITLEIGLIQANLLLNEVTDSEESKKILKEVFSSH